MIRMAGETTAGSPRSNWLAWLGGLTYLSTATAALWALTGLLGAGWDRQPLRLAAAVALLLPAALLLIQGGLRPTSRLLAALAGLLLAATGWLFTPAQPEATSLYQATTTRRYLEQRWASPTLDDLKYADHYRRTLDTLRRDFPSLAAPLEPQWEHWAETMLALIRQRFDAISADDVHAARLFYLQTHPFTRSLSHLRDQVGRAWQGWLERSLAARLDELRRLQPEQWDRFERTAALRRQLVQYYPDARHPLREAERRWIRRSIDQRLEQAEQLVETDPRALRDACRQLKERLRRLATLEANDPFLAESLQRVFDWAQRAAVREVLRHIEARRYLLAYSVARIHALDWLPVVQKWGEPARRRVESLRDAARFLALLAERAPETLPPPRPAEPAEIAPPPRLRD